MSLIGIILVLVIVIACAYVINTMLELPPPIKMIFNVLLAVALLILALSVTGVFGPLDQIRVGPVR